MKCMVLLTLRPNGLVKRAQRVPGALKEPSRVQNSLQAFSLKTHLNLWKQDAMVEGLLKSTQSVSVVHHGVVFNAQTLSL